MASVTTSIRIDEELKKRVVVLAKQMGLNLSQIVEQGLRKFVRDEKITFEPLYDEFGYFEGEEQKIYKQIKKIRKENEGRQEKRSRIKGRRKSFGNLLIVNPTVVGK